MPFFEHDGLQFHYHETGRGLPFIFQHGLGGNLQQPLGLFSPPPGIRAASFDFRGHGLTPMGPQAKIGFSCFAEDIMVFLKYLHQEKAVVGGISMGAAVALNFALRYPGRLLGLVLIRPAWLDGPMEAEVRAIFKLVATLIRDYGAETGLGKFLSSQAYRQLAKTSGSAAQSFLHYFKYHYIRETVAKFEILPEDAPCVSRKEWGKIHVPVLILANQSDPVHPYAYGLQYASEMPHADFREITSKAVSAEQHKKDIQLHLEKFFKENFSICKS
jgi:pimeloyl-ACP methyl ester carboxylesterase